MSDNERYVVRAGDTTDGVFDTVITPERAGWEFCSLRIANLSGKETLELTTDETELLVLPLTTGAEVTVGDETFSLSGRTDVFTSATDYLYVPRRTSFTLRSTGTGRIALPATKATADFPVRYCPVSEARSAIRGSGASSRQVTNYALGNDVQTSHLLVCEVITPGGNWSSYPPHKHDEHTDNERVLEEIYYFEVREYDGHDGFAVQAVYSSPGHDIDVNALVRSGDTVLVPFGYHGPAAAAPFHDLYYLNVMGGPAEDSTWLMTDDPHHGWQRQAWEGDDVDPRLPYYPVTN